VPDVAWAPTPQVSLASPGVDGGAPLQHQQQYQQQYQQHAHSAGSAPYSAVAAGDPGAVADAGRFMFSTDGTADMLAEMNEKHLLQATAMKVGVQRCSLQCLRALSVAASCAVPGARGLQLCCRCVHLRHAMLTSCCSW
jgi:hypothetical protein